MLLLVNLSVCFHGCLRTCANGGMLHSLFTGIRKMRAFQKSTQSGGVCTAALNSRARVSAQEVKIGFAHVLTPSGS